MIDADEQHSVMSRVLRNISENIYLIAINTLLSGVFVTMILVGGSLTPKEIEAGKELKREGVLTYTNDVQVGGIRSATVFYTFIYDGKSYSGKALLPREYKERVPNYSKTGKFPVRFLPRDPSINHPDWTEPFPFLACFLIPVVLVQWVGMAKAIFR